MSDDFAARLADAASRRARHDQQTEAASRALQAEIAQVIAESHAAEAKFTEIISIVVGPAIDRVRKALTPLKYQVRPMPEATTPGRGKTFSYEIFSVGGPELPQAALSFSFEGPHDVLVSAPWPLKFGGRRHAYVRINLNDLGPEKATELFEAYALQLLEPPGSSMPAMIQSSNRTQVARIRPQSPSRSGPAPAHPGGRSWMGV